MKKNPLTRLSLLLFGFIIVYFTFTGITTSPWETDSLAYHLPIASNILKLNFLNIDYQHNPLLLYPGAAEIILAIFQYFCLALNLFNVLALICLFFSCYYLAKSITLPKGFSIIFAVTSCLLPTGIRILTTQKIDLWLVIFFINALTTLINQPKNIKDYLFLGINLGLLIGCKYSGVLFASLLIIFYWQNMIRGIKFAYFSALLLPLLVFGGSWYLRNYYLTGYPLYLAQNLNNYQLYKIIISQSHLLNNLFLVSVSELLLWSLSILVTPLYLVFKNDFKEALQIKKMIILALFCLLICFLLPANPQDLYQWFRFTICGYILLILSSFKLAELYGREKIISHFAIFNQIAILSLLRYRPKIIVGYSTFILSAFFIHLIANKIVKAKPIKEK